MKMELGKHEKRIAIIALHKCGLSQSEIVIPLKLLRINHLFVFTVKKVTLLIGQQKAIRALYICQM